MNFTRTALITCIAAITAAFAQGAYAQEAIPSPAPTPLDAQWVEILAPELAPHRLFFSTTSIKTSDENPDWRDVTLLRTSDVIDIPDNLTQEQRAQILQSRFIELTLDCKQGTARMNTARDYNQPYGQGQIIQTEPARPDFTPATYPAENHLIGKVCGS